MDKKMKSIVEEINNYIPNRDRDLFIQARAQQIIASTTNLINLINEQYDQLLAEDLTRRLINSIKSNDQSKFIRKITQVRDSKKKD